jgi:hypothetical protein
VGTDAERGEQDYADVAARALRALERSERVEPRAILNGYRRALRVWHYPTFGMHRSWTAFIHSKTPKIATRAITWDAAVDRARAIDPLAIGERAALGIRLHPTLTVADGIVPNHEFDLLLDFASRLRLPLVGFRRMMGVDGEYYGVAFDVGLCKVSLEWWGNDPEAWSPLMEWAARMRQLLQRSVDEG